MSLFSWFENLFGGKWTNETVVQYQGDTMEHAIGGYTYKDHINQLRNRRPSLHHTQRLLVDSKIRELEYELSLQIAREKEEERKRIEANQARLREEFWESQQRQKRARKAAEASKPVSGNVIAKPPKFSVDVDDDLPTVSKARDTDNAGWHTHHTPTPSYTPSHSYSSHSSSHSCSSSSHSSSDSGSSSSNSGGGGCD